MRVRSEGLPDRSEGLPARSEGQPDGSEDLPARSEGLPCQLGLRRGSELDGITLLPKTVYQFSMVS